MPILRLRKHQANFSEEDILINPSDYPDLKLNDVVELKPPKGGNASNRILLQVRKWPDTNSYPNSVSIKDSVVNTHLKLYADVLVNIVDKKDVLVDSIEICFSNAYLARSYMWGLRNHLNNRCVYLRQKLDYLHIRSQICEIWAQGRKVSSGYVDDDTKIVFRSASSLVYLFIQMSSEMWDYDINGDLYCEKAVNGFLTDLFETWRRNDCSHDITIILFSRTFYDAESLDEFPKEMRECLQVDYKNRYYEDCYRVAFQNDRFDLHDWNTKLTTLKSLFNQYQKEVIDRHQEKYDTKIPRAYNSSASQGNFLEVLNMSLNVFEKHYFDRSFDRTGQLSVVVSPGVGVFEVDFEMTNLTKQRIIDNGIGSDLVCLGEQPLHTVPLLKFNSKSSSQNDNLATCDVYNMPHWINLSFYSSQNQVYYSNFIPRIKLPTIHNQLTKDVSKSTFADLQGGNASVKGSNNSAGSNNIHHPALEHSSSNILANNTSDENGVSKERAPPATNTSHNTRHPYFSTHQTIPDFLDYDDYDDQVFKPNSTIKYHYIQPTLRGPGEAGEKGVLSNLDSNVDYPSDNDDDFLDRDNRNRSIHIERRSSDVKNYQEYCRNMRRQQMSENLPISQSRVSPQVQTTFTRMSLVDSYLTEIKIKPESADDLSVRGYNVQSSRMNRSSARSKALINPFDPSHMTIKLTPNRRRWTHVFPQGPTGTFIQQHHYQPVPQKCTSPYLADVLPTPPIPEHVETRKNFAKRSYELVGVGNKCEPHPQSALARHYPYSRGVNSGPPSGGVACESGVLRKPWLDNSSIYSIAATNQHPTSGLSSQTSSGYNKSALVSNDTIRFAWCASGEQEWTPAITTGVDWKSLTMPACLPLTTDFFPSKTSLQNDYVIGEYTIDSSCIHSRYTLIEVYRELVCQRLQKGFQIILLPRQTSSNQNSSHTYNDNHHTSHSGGQNHHHHSTSNNNNNNNNNNHHHHHHHHHHHQQQHHHQGPPSSTGHSSSNSVHRSNHGSSSHRHKSSSSSSGLRTHSTSSSTQMDSNENERERTEYTMSIGRIFHKLTLNGNTITVTQYRPRHPYPTIKIDYCYRFRAPFHETYGQSWVHFKSEKLENYSWNYLDNYICARGESFELRSSLKFWRFRLLIIPSRPSLRKIVHEHDAESRHDVHYLEYSDEERRALMESFMKLLEIINKTRRASASRLSSSSYSSALGSSNSSNSQTGSVNIRQIEEQQQISPTRLNVQINNTSSEANQSSSGEHEFRELHFESINMDIDSALRDARRAEWVHVQYHSFYDINQAFELVIKWMVASGAGIAEMVQGWSRKTGNSSAVHVMPIPWEPFALPHSGKADPLRCPIGIQLNLECLGLDCKGLDDNQVIRFQEKILRRFGFITFHDLISSDNIERQFVHMSGFAFIALPNIVSSLEGEQQEQQRDLETAAAAEAAASQTSKQIGAVGNNLPQLPRPAASSPVMLSSQASSSTIKQPVNNGSKQQQQSAHLSAKATNLSGGSGNSSGGGGGGKPPVRNLKLERQETVSSPREEYITRHISGARKNKANRVRGENELIEFIWSWNYMLTKRWRSQSTLDESYAVSLMQDFKDFCQNGSGRLVAFWGEVRDSL